MGHANRSRRKGCTTANSHRELWVLGVIKSIAHTVKLRTNLDERTAYANYRRWRDWDCRQRVPGQIEPLRVSERRNAIATWNTGPAWRGKYFAALDNDFTPRNRSNRPAGVGPPFIGRVVASRLEIRCPNFFRQMRIPDYEVCVRAGRNGSLLGVEAK